MPWFDFKCNECDESVKDVVLKLNHTKTDYPVCPKCHQPMVKQWAAPAAHFVGSGFHCNEYRAPTRG